ncbi:MAG: hypothetical protein WC007_06660 [Pelobacteraceae bacterium]
MKTYLSPTLTVMTMLCLMLVMFGCGGSGSSTSSNTTSVSVSGTVLAGPANGARVTVKTTAGAVVAGPATTAADGSYTIDIPAASLVSDLIFEASGGTFPDEATTTAGVPMATLTAHTAAGSLASGSHVTIDPSSTIVQKLVAGGRSKSAADSVFAAAFGYTPDCSVKPAFATMSSASTTAQRLAGLRAAAFSQMTKDMGLAPDKQFEVIQALADDLSDGAMDGLKTGGTAVTTASGIPVPADMASHFACALMTFQTSPLNKSKLTPDKMVVPFVTKTLTSSYAVEYVPGMKAAALGKTTFKIKLSNLGDGSAATGKNITLVPKMYMATMSHSAPVDTVVESATPGTYDCAVFYQMASGPGMGVWELKVSIGGESAIFYPPVAMSMGTTARATLKGVNDMLGSTATKRTYNLFNDGSTFGMSSTFKLFIAASDDIMMMKFPTVSVNSILTGLTVNTMTVEASADNGATWNSLTDNGSGHWSVAGLTGLATGGTIKVRVTINGEQKTADGNAAIAGTNDFATFTVVAGM